MPQEIRVVKCYECNIFQVDIVKKKNKWSCKLCGVKQTLRQEFFRGTGTACRIKTQELNTLSGMKRDQEAVAILEFIEGETFDLDAEQQLERPSSSIASGKMDNESKWSKYTNQRTKAVSEKEVPGILDCNFKQKCTKDVNSSPIRLTTSRTNRRNTNKTFSIYTKSPNSKWKTFV